MIIKQHWKCRKQGHDWHKKKGGQEICSQCFRVIIDRKLNSKLYSERKIEVSRAVDASYHLRNLERRGRIPKRLFKEVDDSSRVANLLYHLRYVLKRDVQTIEHLGKMSPQALNWYLTNYPWYPGCV